MFLHSDPTGTGLLQDLNAIGHYRSEVDTFDKQFARLPRSAFASIEAFQEVSPAGAAVVDTVTWVAFPRTATASNEQIDADRFQWQDEYVEWRTESVGGQVTRITFTTEFVEYYQALAAAGPQALIAGTRAVIPGANPTATELFGPGFNPDTASATARSKKFLEFATNNPWNNGQKGILCLSQQFNTMSALFNLVGRCAIPRSELDPSAVCGSVGNACGPNRNSDPNVCQASQNLTRAGRGICLQDPAGIRILRLEGLWQIGGQQIDMNNQATNQGTWVISRNGRRAILEVKPDLTLGGSRITSGAQVATALKVGADVVSAREQDLPQWARIGQESSRQGDG